MLRNKTELNDIVYSLKNIGVIHVHDLTFDLPSIFGCCWEEEHSNIFKIWQGTSYHIYYITLHP